MNIIDFLKQTLIGRTITHYDCPNHMPCVISDVRHFTIEHGYDQSENVYLIVEVEYRTSIKKIKRHKTIYLACDNNTFDNFEIIG